jgi:pimeloyl-ACP methyl ester carboxylesterase
MMARSRGIAVAPADLDAFRAAAASMPAAGRTIDVPSLFVSGAADWGTYRKPGALDRMQRHTCTRMAGVVLIDGAGHWVQQERPDPFNAALLDVLARQAPAG